MPLRRTIANVNPLFKQRVERKRHYPRRMEQAGDNMNERELFNSKRWQRLRAFVLRRDEYTDQIQKRFGKRITGQTVHHIFPREQFPEYTFEPWNLITVSTTTHNKLHDRDGHYLTAEGMELLERTARKKNIFISDADKLKLSPPGDR